jgi:twinkle protein
MRERFLELIIKEGVSFCIIDPFNQLTNDYSSTGNNMAIYLEGVLGDFLRFIQRNNVHFIIVTHPTLMKKDSTGNYPVPDYFDISGGAAWNSKSDNLLVYHLPHRTTDPSSTVCEFHSKKIRRQKTVGVRGMVTFEYMPRTRRFMFNGVDYMQKYISQTTEVKQGILPINTNFDKEEGEYEPF